MAFKEVETRSVLSPDN